MPLVPALAKMAPYGSKLAYGALGAGLGFARSALSKYRRGTRTKAKRTGFRRYKAPVAGSRNWNIKRTPFPRGCFKDLVYTYDGSLVTSSTVNIFGNEDSFKLNDPFDPASGAAANKCLYFAECAGLWQYYRVHAVTIEIKWSATDNTNSIGGGRLITASTVPTVVQGNAAYYVKEMPFGDEDVIAPAGEHVVGVQRFYITMKQIEGDMLSTHIQDYTALTTASPARSPLLHLGACCKNGSSVNTTLYYTVRLIYHTKFWGLRVSAAP